MAGRFHMSGLIAMGLILVALMAWVVLLGGAAGLQKDRDTVVGLLNAVNSQPGNLLAFGDIKPESTTQNFISYEWFKAVLQVLTLLAALGAIGAGFHFHARIALVGMFAALAVLFCDACNTFYYLYLQTHNNPAVPKKVNREIETYFAGCIMAAVFDFLLVMVIGSGRDTYDGARTHTTANTAAPVKDTTNGATV